MNSREDHRVEVQSERRPFRVRARHEDLHHGRVVIEPTFEAAAIAYAEHLPVPSDGRTEIGLVVHDVGSGHEHSFWIQLGAGDPDGSPSRKHKS